MGAPTQRSRPATGRTPKQAPAGARSRPDTSNGSRPEKYGKTAQQQQQQHEEKTVAFTIGIPSAKPSPGNFLLHAANQSRDDAGTLAAAPRSSLSLSFRALSSPFITSHSALDAHFRPGFRVSLFFHASLEPARLRSPASSSNEPPERSARRLSRLRTTTPTFDGFDARAPPTARQITRSSVAGTRRLPVFRPRVMCRAIVKHSRRTRQEQQRGKSVEAITVLRTSSILRMSDSASSRVVLKLSRV